MGLSQAYYNARIKQTIVTDKWQGAVDPNIPIERFEATGTLTALLAFTAVSLYLVNGASTPVALDAAYVGAGRKIYIDTCEIIVSGATAWTGGTGTAVQVQDTAGTSVLSAASAALVANAALRSGSTNVTMGAAIQTNFGALSAASLGLQIRSLVGNYGAGSDVLVKVTGTIKPV